MSDDEAVPQKPYVELQGGPFDGRVVDYDGVFDMVLAGHDGWGVVYGKYTREGVWTGE